MTIALANGGPHLFGWGVDRALRADIFDALNVNTKATGNWQKGKIPDFPPWPRPKSTKPAPAEKPRVSLADIYKRFTTKGR